MTTIKDIAKMAGVSSATVSKVINGKDENISAETRNRVLDIVDSVGYIPNGVAKSLRVMHTKTIGIIIPDVMNPFFGELAKGIEDAAETKGYSVILCNSDNKIKKEERYIRVLQEKKVDGIIMVAAENSTGKSLVNCNIPVVLVDRDIEIKKDIGFITVDNKKGAFIATEYLIHRGCKNIGFISSKIFTKTSAERLEGYQEALIEYGYEFNKDLIYYDSFNMETGYYGIKEILKKSKNIDGIFCGNDLIAIGAMKALKENNILVPTEIKIIGYDNISVCEFSDPPLTTIKQPTYEMGMEAVNMILDIMVEHRVNSQKILNPELIKRSSV